MRTFILPIFLFVLSFNAFADTAMVLCEKAYHSSETVAQLNARLKKLPVRQVGGITLMPPLRDSAIEACVGVIVRDEPASPAAQPEAPRTGNDGTRHGSG